MRILFSLGFLLTVFLTNAQDFTQSPYQSLSLSSVLAADFNGDSLPDILGIQYSSNDNNLLLQINNGTSPISFTTKNLNSGFSVIGRPAVADFDGDNDLDIVRAAEGADIYLLINDGSANFDLKTIGYFFGSLIFKIADTDNDDDLDLICINPDNNTLKVFVNGGNLTFSPLNTINTTPDLTVFDVADMDADGKVDIVLGFDEFEGKQVSVYKNNGNNSFSETIVANNTTSTIEDLVVDDLNNDGKPEIVVVRTFGEAVAFVNKGNLVFEKITVASPGGILRSIGTGDFNGDSRKDLVVGTNSAGLYWFKNLTEVNNFNFESQYISGISPVFTAFSADLDHDNDHDLVVSNGEFWWYENNIIQTPSAVNEPDHLQVSIAPNPFSGQVRFDTPLNIRHKVVVMNALGKIVYNGETSEGVVNLASLPTGIYMLKLTNTADKRSATVRLVKK